jgi:hypothetical protein
MRVLDTDYTNYMLMYYCIEDYPEVKENETSVDVHSRLTHQRSISVLLRDPVNFPQEKLLEVIGLLREKVPGVDFDKSHNILDHQLEKCPAGDLFASPGALNTAILKEDLMKIKDEPDEEELARHSDL